VLIYYNLQSVFIMAPFQNSKKRSAPTSGAAAQAKKPRVNDNKTKQNFKDVKGKGKAPSGTKKPIKNYRNTEEKSTVVPKRKQPLTAVGVPQENDEDDDGEMDVDESEEESADVEMSLDVAEDGQHRQGGQQREPGHDGETNKRMSKGKLKCFHFPSTSR
jgi:hypothetical protein